MGCCLSKTRKPDPDPHLTEPTAVAPPPPEEETVVKEVLSETPTPKPPVPNPTREKPVMEMVIEKKENADVSETSDICSVSESASTVPDKEYSSEVRRSPAKIRSRNISGEFPVRRPGPPKRVGSLPGRERNAMSSVRRDPGEISGRRSRSPAMRAVDKGGARPGPGRSPSARKSPGRVRSEDPTRGKEIVAPTESLENPLVSLECFIFL